MIHAGFFSVIGNTSLLSYQMILVTAVTIVALIPMFKREIGLTIGIMLALLYVVSMGIQFIISHEITSTSGIHGT